jgi:hypothetical protein
LVIIPISRSGEMPERAVRSLLPVAAHIQLVASFNRLVDPVADAPLFDLLHRLDATIWRTPRRLGGVQHFNFILSSCRRLLAPPPLQATTVLCDDDELLLEPGDAEAIRRSVEDRIAIWGQYSFAGALPEQRFSEHAFFSTRGHARVSSLQRLRDESWFGGHDAPPGPKIQGSLTGLFAPFGAFAAASRTFGLTRSRHGVKIENTILCWRGVAIGEYPRPIARIHLHGTQSGRALPLATHRRSDLRLKLHALCHAGSVREWGALLCSVCTPYAIAWQLAALAKGGLRDLLRPQR